jgi:hypothetical protein
MEEMLTIAPERRPHAGQDRLGRRDGDEKVRREEPLDVSFVAFIDGRAVAVAGVVDEHVDGAEALLCLLDDLYDQPVVRDVKGEGKRGVRVSVCEVPDPSGVAGGDDRVVTTV